MEIIVVRENHRVGLFGTIDYARQAPLNAMYMAAYLGKTIGLDNIRFYSHLGFLEKDKKNVIGEIEITDTLISHRRGGSILGSILAREVKKLLETKKKERGNAHKGIVRDSSAPPVGEDTVGGQSCKSEDGQGIS